MPILKILQEGFRIGKMKMKLYALEDGFEFVTDENNLVVATKYPGQTDTMKKKMSKCMLLGHFRQVRNNLMAKTMFQIHQR